MSSKQKKKRNKVYSGANASVTRPTVTRLSAANRNAISQWWFEKKRIAKPIIIATLVAIIVIWLLFELIRLISGGGA
jgi:hypothetical protein